MPSSPGIGMHVEVKDPDDKIVLSRVYSSEGGKNSILVEFCIKDTFFSGRISFTSHTPGEHVICMYSNSTAWFSGSQVKISPRVNITNLDFLFAILKLRVHLDIQVGEHGKFVGLF